MTTPVLARLTRSNHDAEIQRHPSIPLVHAQTAIISARLRSSGNHDVVSGPISRDTLRQAHQESAKLQLYDRYSQQMLVLACMFVGVGTSALAINGFNDQPAMRIPLMVATIASWFTLATLFMSSTQVQSLEQLDWARVKRTLMFPAGYLVLSGLAFIVAFLASSWAGTECDAGCRAAGILVERVLVIVVAAGGLGLIYSMQRTLTENA